MTRFAAQGLWDTTTLRRPRMLASSAAICSLSCHSSQGRMNVTGVAESPVPALALFSAS